MAIALAPLVACIARGTVHVSLWLDEIQYWFFERNPALRGIESRRPGSVVAQFFTNYFYCDIQRFAHALMRRFGLTLQRDPELYLRLLSILSIAAATIVVYGCAYRLTRDWWWSTVSALLIGASPMLLFYAFEGRVWAFATLCTVVYLMLLASALLRPSATKLIAGALFGIFLGHVYIYAACLFAAVAFTAALRFAIARDGNELRALGAFALPGGIATAAEAAFIIKTYPATGAGFPLYRPQPFGQLVSVTLSVFSSSGLSTPLSILHFLSLVFLGATLAAVLVALRRSPLLVVPIAAALGLLAIMVLGATRGYVIAPRYEVPLVGALLCSFALAFTKEARICVTLLILVQLFAVPSAVRDVFLKANGKPIATVIAQLPRERTAVVVQHPLRLRYPDPLHTFVLSFYLHGQLPILELPSLRDVRAREGVLSYFDGGPALLSEYASSPVPAWEQQLRAAPWDRICLVTPVPRIDAEARQSEAFRTALVNSGFRLVRGRLVSGYPATQVGLFVRSGAR